MRRLAVLIATVLILAATAAYFSFEIGSFGMPLTNMLHQGLDLQGGVRVVLEAVDDPAAPVTNDAIDSAVEVIRRRVDGMGVNEPLIQREGSRRIVVELAGQVDPDEAVAMIGKTAVLEFRDLDGNVLVSGKDLVQAVAAPDPYGGPKFVINIKFNAEGTAAFRDATTRLVGQPLAVYLDDELVTMPYVDEPITGGEAFITGYDDPEVAKADAIALQSGALPVKLEVKEKRAVSATLGEDSVRRSKTAAGIGIVAVIVLMVLLYRGPGLVASFALGIYIYLLLGAMVLFGVTITLPGIAGVVLSVGMAVDANVLIFERIREELQDGATLRGSLRTGFSRAFAAILDSNVTTIIVAIVLAWLGTGPVRGFAVTLIIGVALSMFTAVTLTRWLLDSLVMSGKLKRSFFGVRG